MTQTKRLLQRAASRAMLASFASALRWSLLAAAGIFLLLLAAVRLLALLPEMPLLPILWGLMGAAFLVAALTARRPAEARVARMVDAGAGTKELFLSAVLMPQQAGAFLPIVQEAAEARAPQVKLEQALPFHWARGTRHVLLAVIAVAVAVAAVPQLDPFKKAAQRARAAQGQKQLADARQLTALRSETLEKEAARQSASVQQALAKLNQTFREARPPAREETQRKLAEEQRELGELWRKVNNDELKEALEKSSQAFGQLDARQRQEWREQMKKGDFSALKNELSDLQKAMSQMAAMPDSADKRAAQEKLAERLNRLTEAMKDLTKSPQMEDAMRRALAQLDAAKLQGLSQDAMKDAADSLKLSQKELEHLEQSMKDGQSLEQALKDLQMAKKLTDAGKLDGSTDGEGKTMEDYEKLFQEKMAQLQQQQEGDGRPGGGRQMGPGLGDGSKRPEDDTVKTDFKSEKSTSMIGNGKMLLQWKASEVGASGTRAEEYRAAIAGVKQSVSQALQAEQVPPGYYDAIKKYFDTLPDKK